MTLRTFIENRKGAKLSAKNLQQLANVHHAVKAIAADANVDLDDIPPEGLGGPDGTIGNPDMAAGQVAAPDGTGMRTAPPISSLYGQVVRDMLPNREQRG